MAPAVVPDVVHHVNRLDAAVLGAERGSVEVGVLHDAQDRRAAERSEVDGVAIEDEVELVAARAFDIAAAVGGGGAGRCERGDEVVAELGESGLALEPRTAVGAEALLEGILRASRRRADGPGRIVVGHVRMEAGDAGGVHRPDLDFGKVRRPVGARVEDIFDGGREGVHAEGLRARLLNVVRAGNQRPRAGIGSVGFKVGRLGLGRVVERVLRVALVAHLEVGHVPGHAGVVPLVVQTGGGDDELGDAAAVAVGVVREVAVEITVRVMAAVRAGGAALAGSAAEEHGAADGGDLDRLGRNVFVALDLDFGEVCRPVGARVEDVFDGGREVVHAVGLRARFLDMVRAGDRRPRTGVGGVGFKVLRLRLVRVVERILRVALVADEHVGDVGLAVRVRDDVRDVDHEFGDAAAVAVSVIREGAVEVIVRVVAAVRAGAPARAGAAAEEDGVVDVRDFRRLGGGRRHGESQQEEGQGGDAQPVEHVFHGGIHRLFGGGIRKGRGLQ